MRQISHHRDLAVLGWQKSILEQEGIAAFILNDNSWWMANGGVALLNMILGKVEEIQNPLFAPVLCIVDDGAYAEALETLLAHQGSSASTADWNCPTCGEAVPGSMGVCWRCEPAPVEPSDL